MKASRKIAMVAVVAAVAAATAVLVLFERDGGAQPTTQGQKPYLVQKNAAASAVKYIQDAPDAKTKKKSRVVPSRFAAANEDGIFRDSDGNPYGPEDQKIMSAAAAAIEKDDLEVARSLAESALASSNAELRAAVVDALGWFGEDAMAELTPFMSDRDPEVAEAAVSHWKDALQEIDEDGMKAGVVEMSLKALADKELLEDVADELIGIDELAAIQVIANVIEDGGSAAASAAVQEVYDNITGEKWSGVDAAEAWLQENYTPDEEDE